MSLVKMINGLINDIGVASEASIKGRLLKLRLKVETQEARLKDLKAQIVKLEAQAKKQKLAPDQGTLNKVQGEFLKILFEESECPISHIAGRLRIQYEMAQHHKDLLLASKMIRWTGGATGDFGEGEPTYELTPKGRVYLVRHGLVQQ